MKNISEQIREKLNEWAGGVGYSATSFRGGGINRGGGGGGYGGGSGGNLQSMYVYQILPLNHTLEPKPDDNDEIEMISPGKMIRGMELNKKDGKYKEGRLLKIERSSEGDPTAYVIISPENSLRMKLDPTTVILIDISKQVDPLDLVIKRDLQRQLKDQTRMDVMRENKIVNEDIENYLSENYEDDSGDVMVNSTAELSGPKNVDIESIIDKFTKRNNIKYEITDIKRKLFKKIVTFSYEGRTDDMARFRLEISHFLHSIGKENDSAI